MLCNILPGGGRTRGRDRDRDGDRGRGGGGGPPLATASAPSLSTSSSSRQHLYGNASISLGSHNIHHGGAITFTNQQGNNGQFTMCVEVECCF